jgi:hypothetical protein
MESANSLSCSQELIIVSRLVQPNSMLLSHQRANIVQREYSHYITGITNRPVVWWLHSKSKHLAVNVVRYYIWFLIIIYEVPWDGMSVGRVNWCWVLPAVIFASDCEGLMTDYYRDDMCVYLYIQCLEKWFKINEN